MLLTLLLACGHAFAQTGREDALIERTVFRAFPEADAYKRIERNVKQEDRKRIENRLPFKVHFDEIGRHCLIVAFRGRRPVGLIYRRTEEADWGLAEIAWHVTLDLRVVGFEFLRGRNRHVKSLERSKLARDLEGRGLDKVIKLVHVHGGRDHSKRDKELWSIERTTLRSAAKALVVIETTWHNEIEKLHDQATGFDLFPAAARFTRKTGTVDLQQGKQQQSVDAKILYAYDLDHTWLGCVVWSETQTSNRRTKMRWVIDRNMRIRDVSSPSHERDLALRKACSQMKGRPMASPPASNSLSQLARGLATVVQQKRRRARR